MSIQIANHKVTDCKYTPAADFGGKFGAGDLRYIVIHYTAGSSFSGAQSTLTSADDTYVSSHMLVGLDGELAQLVPFDTVAWHAGKSSWHGLESLNNYSIGIELVNPGYAREGISYAGPTIRAVHKNGGPARDWFLYPTAQIEKVAELCTALCRTYPTILGIVGHDDIAPDRKLDPGPAWDWQLFRGMLGASDLERKFAQPTWKSELELAACDFARAIQDHTPVGADRASAIRLVRQALWTAQAAR